MAHSFKPFGRHEYSYPTNETLTPGGYALWFLQTLGSFAVDWREAGLILGGALCLQETVFYAPQVPKEGSSFVWNVQLGYCLLRAAQGHVAPLVKVTAALGLLSDGWALVQTQFDRIDNWAHGKGLLVGVAGGLLFNFGKKKKPLV